MKNKIDTQCVHESTDGNKILWRERQEENTIFLQLLVAMNTATATTAAIFII